MMEWLLEPFKYEFMIRGFLAATFVGAICSIIGCYIVLRSMAFLGDALAHAILPGIAVAYLLKGDITLAALFTGVLSALGINFLSKQGSIKEDTAIGILFSASLALGIAIISSIRTYAVDLSHILFGNVLGVSNKDLLLTAILGSLILLLVLLFYRPFMIVSFDPVLATTLRIPVDKIRSLMLVMMAITIVIAIQSVGVTLVVAMLVTPSATSYLITKRLPAMMAVSAIVGFLSSVIGLYASYYWNIASGAAIVLAATCFFLVAFLFSPQKGILLQRFTSPAKKK